MWGVRQLGGQVLTGEVELLVEEGSPLWAVGHIVDHATAGDPGAGAALTGVAAQLSEGNEAGCEPRMQRDLLRAQAGPGASEAGAPTLVRRRVKTPKAQTLAALRT
jgi:hypothetical protein